MQRRQKATNDAAAAARDGRERRGGHHPSKPCPRPAPKITHNLWPLRVRRSRILHLVTPARRRDAMRKIYGVSSAAAPGGIYVEIISVNILYLINMVHSSSNSSPSWRGGRRGQSCWQCQPTKKLPCDSRFFIVYYATRPRARAGARTGARTGARAI